MRIRRLYTGCVTRDDPSSVPIRGSRLFGAARIPTVKYDGGRAAGERPHAARAKLKAQIPNPKAHVLEPKPERRRFDTRLRFIDPLSGEALQFFEQRQRLQR